jgi:hypothetical protein
MTFTNQGRDAGSDDGRTRVVHCKKSPYDVYIGRGRGSVWGNPYTHKSGTLAEFVVPTVAEAIKQYEIWFRQQTELIGRLAELRGKILGCWCKPGPCHGDVLAKWADAFG